MQAGSSHTTPYGSEIVRVLYAFICEDARERHDGRLDAHGVFHQLHAPGFPAQQERMVVAIALEWDAGESGRADFRIDLTDPTGSPAITINGHTEISPRVEGESPPQTRLIMPLEGVVFPTGGTYEFELFLGAERLRLCPLHIVELSPAGEADPGGGRPRG